MELEEIKNAWLSVDERLKKQEMMNERMIKETLQSKSKKALSKLNGYELFGVIVCFAMLPLVIFMIGKGNFYRPNQLASFLLYFCAVMLAVGCITQSIKLLILAKINFTKALSSNVRIVQRYKLFIRKEKMATWIITPIITVLLILIFVNLNSKFELEAWRWVALIAIIIFGILITVWQYKKIYDANIQSIMNNLEELKEMEE